MRLSPRLSRRGFTLAEILVTMGISLLVGMMVFLVLNAGMVLYAKNTAVNSAHQQARSGIDQMLFNLHSSVSIPQLVDENLNSASELDSNGSPIPRAGISFQTFNGGPFPVAANASASDTSITLHCPGYTPPANARLNIPPYNIEYDVISYNDTGSDITFNLATPAGGIGTGIAISGNGREGGSTQYVISAFITTRMSYAVNATELRYYPTNNLNSYKVITRNVISQTPFTVPILSGGGLQNRFVAAVNLSTVEPQFTSRGYAAVNMFISSLIPFRSRLTNTQ
ncbi:MAG: PulJ/GspJ family protein [Chthoniobacterales bacterium]